MRRVVVHTRLSESDLNALDALASEHGLTRAAAMRALLVQGIAAPPREPPSEQELLQLLAAAARSGSTRATELLLRRVEAEAGRPSSEPDADDGFAEADQLAAQRRRHVRPDGY
jgi:hypothetical protein